MVTDTEGPQACEKSGLTVSELLPSDWHALQRDALHPEPSRVTSWFDEQTAHNRSNCFPSGGWIAWDVARWSDAVKHQRRPMSTVRLATSARRLRLERWSWQETPILEFGLLWTPVRLVLEWHATVVETARAAFADVHVLHCEDHDAIWLRVDEVPPTCPAKHWKLTLGAAQNGKSSSSRQRHWSNKRTEPQELDLGWPQVSFLSLPSARRCGQCPHDPPSPSPSHKHVDARSQNTWTQAWDLSLTYLRYSKVSVRETRSTAPTPSIGTLMALGSISECACNESSLHSMSAVVEMAVATALTRWEGGAWSKQSNSLTNQITSMIAKRHATPSKLLSWLEDEKGALCIAKNETQMI